jgi:hypothetical protein
MAYCPKCSTEYSEGSTECIDCHLPLKPGSLPALIARADQSAEEPDAKLVKIRTFGGPTAALDAELAKNILEAEGIACALPGEGHAEMLPGIDVVHLMVREEDAERAAEILASFLDNPPMLSPDDEPTPAA